MENLFDPRVLASLPWSPLALWQANIQIMSRLQQSWLQAWMTGTAAVDGTMTGLSSQNGRWSLPEPFIGGMMPFMPRVEASITPLKREGKLVGAEDAARVTMRMTFPGLGGGGRFPEIVLVDAVVARAVGEEALRLDSNELPATLPGKS